MDGTTYGRVAAGFGPDGPVDEGDERLLQLCAVFVGRAEARTAEGHRLDGLPWSSEVDAGYRELSRGARNYGTMLTEILESRPTTIRGLVAKARVISRHQEDGDADPIAAGILARDVLRVCSNGDKADEDHSVHQGSSSGGQASSSGR
jgi:hypothetical protein